MKSSPLVGVGLAAVVGGAVVGAAGLRTPRRCARVGVGAA